MLLQSKPLAIGSKLEKELTESADHSGFSPDNVESQYIGSFFDDFKYDSHKISLKTRLEWAWRDLKGKYHDMRYRIRNRRVWRKTLNEIRPWEGFHGLLTVMQTHLRDYLEIEEKYSHTAEEERNRCIASLKETLSLLERMNDPDEYYHRRKEAVDDRYPKYKSLITHYKNGGSSTSGDFVAQGGGWVGQEAGKDPREGYFEFINGEFELTESPDQTETDRLLAELRQY
ncbi:MAG: hypothetical protein LBB94_00785, partial [Clostridiales bacterium]|nr:hypothetical protein [Clostridiales bacterium]